MPRSPTTFYHLRPKLEEILDDAAPSPYTLSTFMDFLSHNHCLETLEFILGVRRYRKTYLLQQNFCDPAWRDARRKDMMVQWQHLMTTYITPSAPREINISPAVLTELLDFTNPESPPPPELLERPVRSMHQLIEDSVLAPFFEECSRKYRTVSLSAPSLVSTRSISPRENLDNCETKACPSAYSTDYKIGEKPRGMDGDDLLIRSKTRTKTNLRHQFGKKGKLEYRTLGWI